MLRPLINTDISMPDDIFDALIELEGRAIGAGLKEVSEKYVRDFLTEKSIDPSLFQPKYLYPVKTAKDPQ